MAQLKGLHIDRFLTNLSLQYKNQAFVNEVLFPVVMVEYESDLVPVYDQAMLFTVYETRRADGSRSNEVDWKLAPSLRYTCEQYALKDIVTDRQRRNADTPLTVEIDTMEFVQDSLDLEKEYRAAQLARNAANYVPTNVAALSGTSQWSDYANSDPLQDIKRAQAQIFKASRMMANTIIFPYQVALTLSYHPKILDLIKYTHADILQNDTQLPKKLFGMNVVVAGAGYNTANKGQPINIDDVWGKDVIFAYVESAPKIKSISFGKTFRVTKYVRKWRDEERAGDIIECNDLNDMRIIANATGFLLQNAIA